MPYESLKTELLVKLLEKFNCNEINEITAILDLVVSNYEITKKITTVAVYNSHIPEAVKTFMACKKIEGYSDGTLINYKNLLMNFFTFINKDIKDITTNDIRVFLYKYQETRAISNRTLCKYQDNLKAFFAWCFNEDFVEKNIASKLKPIKYEEKPRQALTQLELEQVRDACTNPRDKAIIEFFYSTGCRVSELCIVKKSDINWADNTVHLFGKGSKHRVSFINAKAEYALKQYLATRDDDSEYLFVSLRKPYDKLNKCGVEKIIRNIADKINIDKKLSPHIIRHTTCTQALKSGMPVDEIQKMVGHAHISTTMIYAKTDIENVRASHQKYII